jgi:hypothetical protein
VLVFDAAEGGGAEAVDEAARRVQLEPQLQALVGAVHQRGAQGLVVRGGQLQVVGECGDLGAVTRHQRRTLRQALCVALATNRLLSKANCVSDLVLTYPLLSQTSFLLTTENVSNFRFISSRNTLRLFCKDRLNDRASTILNGDYNFS